MYTVVVVDDEPTALNHIMKIIEMKCQGFRCIGYADDGLKGLDMVLQLKPDVLISDVKMPALNGVDLASKVKDALPQCMVLLVSGFQDFEYLKGAVQLGVCDYLLKPVTPKNMVQALETIEKRLIKIHGDARNRLVSAISKGQNPNHKQLKRYFPHAFYYAALIRKNGLPKRFSAELDVEIFSDIKEQMFLYGRDEMESLYIIPGAIVGEGALKTIIDRLTEKESHLQHYVTTVIYDKRFIIDELPSIMCQLYHTLEKTSVIGRNQIIMAGVIENKSCCIDSIQSDGMDTYELYIREKRYEAFKELLKHDLKSWQGNQMPQLMVERYTRQIIYLFQKYETSRQTDHAIEMMLDDAFFYSTSMEELFESVCYMLNKCFCIEAYCSMTIDRPDFMASVKTYICKNLAKEITLQSICKQYSVSQTYFSRVFKKHEGISFNHYLTSLRIDKAKAIIHEHPDYYIKDIAGLVGYKDQFYFSRIFKSLEGCCPTEYGDQLKSTKI